jgi:hypothetical protein
MSFLISVRAGGTMQDRSDDFQTAVDRCRAGSFDEPGRDERRQRGVVDLSWLQVTDVPLQQSHVHPDCFEAAQVMRLHQIPRRSVSEVTRRRGASFRSRFDFRHLRSQTLLGLIFVHRAQPHAYANAAVSLVSVHDWFACSTNRRDRAAGARRCSNVSTRSSRAPSTPSLAARRHAGHGELDADHRWRRQALRCPARLARCRHPCQPSATSAPIGRTPDGAAEPASRSQHLGYLDLGRNGSHDAVGDFLLSRKDVLHIVVLTLGPKRDTGQSPPQQLTSYRSFATGQCWPTTARSRSALMLFDSDDWFRPPRPASQSAPVDPVQSLASPDRLPRS